MRRATYRFSNGRDEQGFPNINREMTPQQYDLYNRINKELERMIRENTETPETSVAVSEKVSIDIERLPLVWQGSDECMAMSYPTNGYEWRTVATSGIFPIVTYMTLKYYDIEVTLEDLVRIAVWGDWHHVNGTWHHYLDVMCDAYGLQIDRVTSLRQLANCMQLNGLAVAMLDNDMFPNAKGNVLVVITEISADTISFYYPGDKNERTWQISNQKFLKHSKVFWAIKE